VISLVLLILVPVLTGVCIFMWTQWYLDWVDKFWRNTIKYDDFIDVFKDELNSQLNYGLWRFFTRKEFVIVKSEIDIIGIYRKHPGYNSIIRNLVRDGWFCNVMFREQVVQVYFGHEGVDFDLCNPSFDINLVVERIRGQAVRDDLDWKMGVWRGNEI
jgi:hypothetical protein